METTSVIICGCGPTGATLSGYLALYGVPNIVLERDRDIAVDPRGIALDEDGIRLLQGLGLYDKVYTEIGHCTGMFHFIGGTKKDLHAKSFFSIDYSTSEGGTGHVGLTFQRQPVLEKYLRQAATSSPTSQIRTSVTVHGVSEDDDWVYADYIDEGGKTTRLRGKFLIGADGKTGFVRKKYLEPRGVFLEQVSETSYEEVWVAMNWKMELPTPQSHPDFPLWKLDFTPEKVYDEFFPTNFRFLCNPERSSVCGRFGLPTDRLWRFEFVIKKGEDGDAMSTPEKVKEIVWPYLTHAGSRFGLAEDVTYPEDCIQILRCRPFCFNARSCNMWSLNRVAIMGDAAHVIPPFGGQGLASGMRDAVALAWRLGIATGDNDADYKALFQGWEQERKQQFNRSLAATIRNGEMFSGNNFFKTMFRDWSLWLTQLVPSWRRALDKGTRSAMVKYQYAPGMTFLPEMNGGVCLPQVYCRSLSRGDMPVQFTDDVVFAADKKTLFQILVVLRSTSDLEAAWRDLQAIDALYPDTIHAQDAVFLIHDHRKASEFDSEDQRWKGRLFRTATAEEFAQHERLCKNRPVPTHYNKNRIWQEVKGNRFVVVRPDRFVFAACSSVEDLALALQHLSKFLGTSVTLMSVSSSIEAVDENSTERTKL
ncbi:MAG: hypothetical protein M1820_001754 [Bogoriella megaspora]|nr:MAG: hypothetical protein M1820_001754 [Bogoriella megaspora]